MIQDTTSGSYLPILFNRDSLYFISSDRRMKVGLDRITHISAEPGHTVIHTLGRRYPVAYELSDMYSLLPPAQFYRIHPLHVVALQHVQAMDGKEVMIAGERLFTTQYYRQQLIEALKRRRPQITTTRKMMRGRDTLS